MEKITLEVTIPVEGDVTYYINIPKDFPPGVYTAEIEKVKVEEPEEVNN
jgi:hypothetical protein